jgi:hypothetical protein
VEYPDGLRAIRLADTVKAACGYIWAKPKSTIGGAELPL